ncbi:MAG: YihA family ribosome biogenesis GTP-binding protein [Candidatus Nitronauta litoralis]|uniref:Probable GTP-binding protein EngB n=1 Tax=Candidatus Nitronauta litoralis TaxID=2705533 RepID=A0A7T0BU10_9BACT|nr:MAG: YihA family ribosome biogenesis GTP-binding protein [Candidatus Nitronauta litoralis]
MKIHRAEFITGAVQPKQYPDTALPEVAFAGRSNVGKSSLLNSLLNRKKLVKTSSTPGKTQEINFFDINSRWIFTDLPGYGFAKAPSSVRKKWGVMIERYLTGREPLKLVVLILDIRRNPTDLDLQMQEWLEHYQIPYLLVATKADKLKQGETARQLKKIKAEFDPEGTQQVIAYSSQSDLGRKILWGKIRNFLLEETTEATSSIPPNEI